MIGLYVLTLLLNAGPFAFFFIDHPWKSDSHGLESERNKILTSAAGPPLFGLYPNGLYPNGLSLNGLQGQLDYPQLDYL